VVDVVSLTIYSDTGLDWTVTSKFFFNEELDDLRPSRSLNDENPYRHMVTSRHFVNMATVEVYAVVLPAISLIAPFSIALVQVVAFSIRDQRLLRSNALLTT
jgi:hypothetical protein